jgi:hypothetical protein
MASFFITLIERVYITQWNKMKRAASKDVKAMLWAARNKLLKYTLNV